MARPTKYKKEYCELLVDHMSQGMSFESFAGRKDVRVSFATLYNWKNENPEFLEAYKKGEAARRDFDEKIYLAALLGKKYDGNTINTGLLIFKFKTQHKWREQIDVGGDAFTGLADLFKKAANRADELEGE